MTRRCPKCGSTQIRYLYTIGNIERFLCLSCLCKFDLTPNEEFVALPRPREA